VPYTFGSIVYCHCQKTTSDGDSSYRDLVAYHHRITYKFAARPWQLADLLHGFSMKLPAAGTLSWLQRFAATADIYALLRFLDCQLPQKFVQLWDFASRFG
jgi:hypothetical protein